MEVCASVCVCRQIQSFRHSQCPLSLTHTHFSWHAHPRSYVWVCVLVCVCACVCVCTLFFPADSHHVYVRGLIPCKKLKVNSPIRHPSIPIMRSLEFFPHTHTHTHSHSRRPKTSPIVHTCACTCVSTCPMRSAATTIYFSFILSLSLTLSHSHIERLYTSRRFRWSHQFIVLLPKNNKNSLQQKKREGGKGAVF